jgi:hypothetical protein
MTALTTEQFKDYFQIKGNTVILSPQVAMIASLCGHTDFDYQLPSKDTTDTSFSQYDTVLIDVLDKDKFPGFYGGVLHSFRFLTYALNFLGGSGTLIGKFPSPLLNKAISFPHSRHLDSKGHTEEIHIFEDYFFVKIVKNASNNKTKVFYENGNEVEVQTKYPILHHYNQEYYGIIRLFKPKIKNGKQTFQYNIEVLPTNFDFKFLFKKSLRKKRIELEISNDFTVFVNLEKFLNVVQSIKELQP